MSGRKIPTEERFWAKVDRRGPDDCWYWTGRLTERGYGAFGGGGGYTAHRFSFGLAYGRNAAAGLVVDHTCHNNQDCPPGPCPHRKCVNPAHLDAVTSAVNINRSHNSNLRKTHCPKGHEYTPENTRLQIKANTTCRSCKACFREADRQRHRDAAARKRLTLQETSN